MIFKLLIRFNQHIIRKTAFSLYQKIYFKGYPYCITLSKKYNYTCYFPSNEFFNYYHNNNFLSIKAVTYNVRY